MIFLSQTHLGLPVLFVITLMPIFIIQRSNSIGQLPPVEKVVLFIIVVSLIFIIQHLSITMQLMDMEAQSAITQGH